MTKADQVAELLTTYAPRLSLDALDNWRRGLEAKGAGYRPALDIVEGEITARAAVL